MFKTALELYHLGNISESRLAALAFLAMGEFFHPRNFIQGRSLRLETHELLQGISDAELAALFRQSKFKCIKSKAVYALSKWLTGEWSLVLLDHVPSVYEVLSLQAAGKRCVTLFFDASCWQEPKLTKENALHFFVHDLEHAVQFFDFYHADQIALNQRLLKLYDQGHFLELKNTDLESRLDYLLSDMNTHPEHSHQFLEAIWYDYSKVQNIIDRDSFVNAKMKPLMSTGVSL